MVDILTDKEHDVISGLTYHAIDNPIELKEYPYQGNKTVLMPDLPDTSPFILELGRLGWFGEMIVKPLYSIPYISGSIPVEGQVKPRLSDQEVQAIQSRAALGTTSGVASEDVPPSSTETGVAGEPPRRTVREMLSRYLPFLRRRNRKPPTLITELQSDSYPISTPSGIQRIDLSKLDEIDILKKQNQQILKKLSSMGLTSYAQPSSGSTSGVFERIRDIGSASGSAIASVFKRKRISVRGLEFYISPETTTESQISSKLMNVFGSKLDVKINGREPTENEVVVIKVEPVGQSPADVVYNFLEENIRKHVSTDKYLFINGTERIDGDKFGDYIRELGAISSDLYEESDKNSYKNFIVVLRLIHMEMLKEINKYAKVSHSNSNVIVVLPWCFVNHSVPSVPSPPEQRLYSDMPDSDGLRFITGVVSVLPSGESTEQIYFNENTLRTGLEQSLEAKTETEKALYTLANTSIELAKEKKDDDDTLQIMKFIFYTHPKGYPQIVSRGSLERLERSIQSSITELKGPRIFNEGELGEDSIFQTKYIFTEDVIKESEFIPVKIKGRRTSEFRFNNKAIINPGSVKSSYIYDRNTDKIKSLKEFVSYMYSVFKKFTLVFDVIKNIKDVIPDAIKSELGDAVNMFINNNPYIMVLITNTYHSSFKGHEKELGISFLRDMIKFNKVFLKQVNDTLLYAIKKGVVIDRDIIAKINNWLTIVDIFEKTDRQNYSTFLKNQDNHIYNLEYEVSVSRAIKKAQDTFTTQGDSKVDVEPSASLTQLPIRRPRRGQDEPSTLPEASATAEEEEEEDGEAVAPEEAAAEEAAAGEAKEAGGEAAEEAEEDTEDGEAAVEEADTRLEDYKNIINEHYEHNRLEARSIASRLQNTNILKELSSLRQKTEENVKRLAEIFIELNDGPPKVSSGGIRSRETRRRSKRRSKRTTIKRKRKQ